MATDSPGKPSLHAVRRLGSEGSVRTVTSAILTRFGQSARTYRRGALSRVGERPARPLDTVKSGSDWRQLDDSDGGGFARHEHLLPFEFAFSLSLRGAGLARHRDPLPRPACAVHRSEH